jgi:hypothetical protein
MRREQFAALGASVVLVWPIGMGGADPAGSRATRTRRRHIADSSSKRDRAGHAVPFTTTQYVVSGFSRTAEQR